MNHVATLIFQEEAVILPKHSLDQDSLLLHHVQEVDDIEVLVKLLYAFVEEDILARTLDLLQTARASAAKAPEEVCQGEAGTVA